MINYFGESAEEQLPEGLYELLSTDLLTTRLHQSAGLQPVFAEIEDEDSPDILSRHVADVVRKALAGAKPTDRVAMANRLL